MPQVKTCQSLTFTSQTGEQMLESYNSSISDDEMFKNMSEREKVNTVLNRLHLAQIYEHVALRNIQAEQKKVFQKLCGNVGHVYTKEDVLDGEIDVCMHCGHLRDPNEGKLPIGTKIRFNKDITLPATGDHPAYILAREGDLGEIAGHNNRPDEGYMLLWEACDAPFGGSEKDFTVITNV